MFDEIFSLRWLIGGFIFLLCLIFEIHGSSMGFYADILSHPELSDIIFGKYRPIRSDEWAVFTPFAFSQYFTNFSMIGDVVRAAPTNMFMTYGQAVFHPAIIFRPFQIGYLFFDQGSGLAFFWMGRQIILFLISLEFAKFILKCDKKFSVLYAIMISFSPLAQWWWSVNSIAEILIAGQGVVIFWKLYLDNETLFQRYVYAIFFLWFAGIFIFGIYPAWQVSFGYIFLFCILAISFQKSNALKNLWYDKFFWIAGFLIMLAPIVHAVYVSRDMIELQMATEYPGRRFTTGGGLDFVSTIKILFMYGFDTILPFKPLYLVQTNNSEAASFFTMMPLGLILYLYVRFKLKQKDLLLDFLFVITILFTFWEFTQIPSFLAKISFMSNVTNTRMRSAIDFAQVLILFRSLTMINISLPTPIKFFLAGIIALLPTIIICNFIPTVLSYRNILTMFIFIFVSTSLFLTPLNKKNFAILAVMMLGIGATVNPINAGVDTIYKMPVGQKISEIVQQDKNALWITVKDSFWINNFPIMFGAKTINSTNVYPYFGRWEKLDPIGKNKKIYNRYAHITLDIKDNPTTFKFVNADAFQVEINSDDLQKLNIKYIFTRHGDLENFSTPQTNIQKIYEDAGSFIYKVN